MEPTQASPQGKSRWQLTEETLACLLGALHGAAAEDPDRSLALQRYQRLQQRLIFFFMRHRSIFPEDLADEALNRLARALFEGRSIANLEAFALGVARMVLREEQARILREQRSYQEAERNRKDFTLTSSESDSEIEAQEAQLASLPPAARTMLTQYHAGSGAGRIAGRQQLAQEMGLSMGALRKRVFDLQSSIRLGLKRALGESGSRLPDHKENSHR
jgi:DNA-directed RNA polymerase specialized sigma24 family protein